MTWVTDLSHFIDDTGNLPTALPGPARQLAKQLNCHRRRCNCRGERE